MDWARLSAFFEQPAAQTAASVGLELGMGLALAFGASRALHRLFARRISPQQAILVRRITFYGLATLVLLSALRQLGLDLSLLVGAAGIVTVALGFASQTSASNLISGLFLLAEEPFAIGDVIAIGDLKGEVVSIDLLSAKIRTFDNLYVRVPNETLIKTEIVNMTRYPIRRFAVDFEVAYKEDLARVRELIEATLDARVEVLDEPSPIFRVQGFGASGVSLRVFAWTRIEGWFELESDLRMDIKRALDDAGIEIPFPHVSLYAGSATEPIPVRVEPPA